MHHTYSVYGCIMTKTNSKDFKGIQNHCNKEFSYFFQTNRVESWNKHLYNPMVLKAGSSKHFDGRGILLLVTKNNTILNFYSRHFWKIDIMSFQMSYAVALWWLSIWLNFPKYGAFEGSIPPLRSHTPLSTDCWKQ